MLCAGHSGHLFCIFSLLHDAMWWLLFIIVDTAIVLQNFTDGPGDARISVLKLKLLLLFKTLLSSFSFYYVVEILVTPSIFTHNQRIGNLSCCHLLDSVGLLLLCVPLLLSSMIYLYDLL